MRLVIQRVSEASVTVEGEVVGKIGTGFMVLVGIEDSDDEKVADKMLKKMIGLRIFEDSEGKTNLSLTDVDGSLLLVSQFTLYADCRKGNRPSFFRSGDPDHANKLYEYVLNELRSTYGIHTESGVFGADMKVSLVNDGPFTVMLDSDEIFGN